MRRWLVERSQRCQHALDPALTAYTPGETLDLLDHPVVHVWHQSMADFKIPEYFDRIVLVPCAKTKPWSASASRRSVLYQAYHRVLARAPDSVYFVTLSEPLGVVPQHFWPDFPPYDVPGLFRDEAQRAGATRADWAKGGFAEALALPFDARAYARSMRRLADVIAIFLRHNARPGREVLAFVDVARGQSTHAEMLDLALAQSSEVAVRRYWKRPAPRRAPDEYILDRLAERQSLSGDRRGRSTP